MAFAAPQAAQAEQVVTKAACRAAERLGLKQAELKDILGLSAATVSRMQNGAFTLSRERKEFELAALLIRAFRALDAIVGGDERAAKAWMRGENTALGGAPADRMTTITGLADVVAYLDSRRAPL